MTPSIMIVDDFFPNAISVRNFSLSQEFSDFTGPDGGVYTNTVNMGFPHVEQQLALLFKQPVQMLLSAVRVNLADEMPHSFVHADTGYGEYAGVVYLNLPSQCSGGTAFWTHIDSGLDRLPKSCLGLLPTQITHPRHKQIIKDWGKAEAWKQTGFVGMKFNRALFYKSSLFHSRFPWPGFGSTHQDGRLILALFFNIFKTG